MSRLALALLALLAWATPVHADPTWGRQGGVPVTETRAVNTTAPLAGGGALSSDLTLTCATCTTAASTFGTDNVVLRSDGTSRGAQSTGITVDDSNRVGIGLATPSHSLTFPSTGTGAAWHNTADTVTNTETGLIGFAANEFLLSTAAGGSGTARSVRLRGGTSGAGITLPITGGPTYSAVGGFTVTAHTFSHASFTSTSLLQTGLSLASTVNQASGSGGYNGYLCNPTLTAVGSAGAKCFRAQNGGSDRWWIDAVSGTQDVDSTITAAATTGNQTINKPAGTVNVAAAGTTITVTNSLVTASSIISVLARTNDATCAVKNYVPAAGSFVINMTAGCTAETSVGFMILDKN